MAFTNNMTLLLNKLERRLGLKPLNLPEDIRKDKWADDIIIPDTLTTFSRYFPNEFKYTVNTSENKKDGYYLIDEAIADNAEILGIRDISWEDFSNDSLKVQQDQGYGIYDYLSYNYGMEDAMMLQMRADHMSLFNNGVYPEFVYPNKIAIKSVTGATVSNGLSQFKVILLIKHSANLSTISPTKMETFESLAQADLANYLFKYLKYYDQLETVYATIDLKLSDLETEAGKRDDIIQQIKDGYVSAANDNQPIIFTV